MTPGAARNHRPEVDALRASLVGYVPNSPSDCERCEGGGADAGRRRCASIGYRGRVGTQRGCVGYRHRVRRPHAVRTGPPPRLPSRRGGGPVAPVRSGQGGVQPCQLTCAHDCCELAGRRFCRPVARRNKTAGSVPTPAAETLLAAPVRADPPGGTAMLLVDLRGTLMLLNEARYRSIEKVFGVPRDQVNVTTAILALLVAEAIHTQ